MKYVRSRLKWNGWGWKATGFDLSELSEHFWEDLKGHLGLDELKETPSIALEDVKLPTRKIQKPLINKLIEMLDEDRVKIDRFERIFHAKGKSYHDLIRVRKGDMQFMPDVVVYPETTEEVRQLINFANTNNSALIPFGGGSSVVGGVEATRRVDQHGIICLDTSLMDQLVDLDRESHTATFQCGIYGPNLEHILQTKGYTLGHFPQSFEFSTLGGWIAARGAGQNSDRYGKAEEFTVAARLVSPTGDLNTCRFPASAAGPDLNHLIAGSEGILGVITEATVKIHPRPKVQDYRGFLFRDFASGLLATRKISQEDIPISMMRLSDEDETRFFTEMKKSSAGSLFERGFKKLLKARGYTDTPCLMLMGLEGDSLHVYSSVAQVTAICVGEGGVPLGKRPGDSWVKSRFHMPYLRDNLMDRGIGVDTLETSTVWSNMHNLQKVTKEAINNTLSEQGLRGMVMCHVSHSYHEGASLYFTFVFPIKQGEELEQWRQLKKAASDAILENGGTISHHHGVGMDHVPWLNEEKGVMGMNVIKNVKKLMDPQGIMNPGKIVGTVD